MQECTYVPVDGDSSKEKCTGCGNVRTVAQNTIPEDDK